jgi:hypothetical protein
MRLSKYIKATVVISLAALSLSGCATVSLAPKGNFALGASSVTLSRDWSDVSVLYYNRAKKVKILSIDAPGLNRLFISEGLTAKDPLMVHPMKGDNTNAPAPRGKDNMSLQEQIEFVAASLSALEFQKVETSSPKPVTLGAQRAVRFEFTAKTPEGLNIKGVAQAAAKGNLHYYIVYVAPEEHYFNASLKEVLVTMDSVKLP